MTNSVASSGAGPSGRRHGMGWLPDPPDIRDKTLDDADVVQIIERTGAMKLTGQDSPTQVDLRQWCPPVENQGQIGSCTANAGVGLLEYYQRRAFGKHIDGSRMFLYKATRNYLQLTGDTGAWLRSTIGTMRLFGVCPERFWPYSEADFDEEPTAFCYAFAKNYEALRYYRLDPRGIGGARVLENVRTQLAANLPSMFGFTVYASIQGAGDSGEIPMPAPGEDTVGGHAVVAVGYDDAKEISNSGGGSPTQGALLIRNSWGEGWGENGYGWLPYAYVTEHLAVDFWVLTKAEWVDSGRFDR